MTARLATKEIDALADKIAETASHIDAATHTLMTDIRAFDRAGGWGRQGARDCAHWLSWRIGIARGAALEHVRVASALGDLPLVDDAFRRGSISYSKIRAITRVANATNEAKLLDLARYTTGAMLEVAVRKYRTVEYPKAKDESEHRYVRRRDLDNGMVKVDIALRADEAAILFTLLDKLAADEQATSARAEPPVPQANKGDVCRLRTKKFDRADALVAMVQTQMRGKAPARTPVELIVVVDPETKTGMTGDGTALSAEIVERLACDCAIVETNPANTNVGRKRRTPNAALRRALERRDPHCRWPGCTNRVFLDYHHANRPWALGGETTLEDGCRVCTFHHALCHQGFACRMVDGIPEFRDPLGRVIVAVPEAPPAPLPAFETLRRLREAEAIEIDEMTNAPRWDGRPPDYRSIVLDLCREQAMDLSQFRIPPEQYAANPPPPTDCRDTGCGTGETCEDCWDGFACLPNGTSC